MADDAREAWEQIFAEVGLTYRAPQLRFVGAEQPTQCHEQPPLGWVYWFYCPPDGTIYLTSTFLTCNDDKRCKFAEAYVIAREVGHHVQALLGILPKVLDAQVKFGDVEPAAYLQKLLELQADCFVGVWVNRSNKHRQLFFDVAEEAAWMLYWALNPESKHWFMTGVQKGTVQACDTFDATQL